MERKQIDLTYRSEEELSLAIGFFDGLHLGHQELLKETISSKYKKGILTFSSDFKSEILHKEKNLLLTEEEKDEILKSYDLDFELVLPFSKEVMNTSKEDFVIFLKNLNVKKIVVGDDFTFAKNALGKASDLKVLEKEGIEVKILSLKKVSDEKISSTLIKRYLSENKIESADNLLGYNFYITNKVEHGFQNGRKINFKTANILYPKDKFKLNDGVYKTLTYIDNKVYKSMSNVGKHPTIDELKAHNIETYIIDFDSDIYEKEIRVEFLSFIREERQFSSLEELKKQLQKDVLVAKE